MDLRLIALVSCVASGPVFAGGLTAPAPEADIAAPAAPVASFDWTGFYVGLSLGQGSFSGDDGVSDTDTDLVGLQAGYLRDLGRFVVGAELAYAQGELDSPEAEDWDSTRFKLIGGYDAGRVMPYGFVGLSDYGYSGLSDSATIYGLGARFALGDSGRVLLGVEYLVETKDDYAGEGSLEGHDVALRVDYRF